MAANERITIYELKLAEEMCQMEEKLPTPYKLADFDITNLVVKFEPFLSRYYVLLSKNATIHKSLSPFT